MCNISSSVAHLNDPQQNHNDCGTVIVEVLLNVLDIIRNKISADTESVN